MKRIRSRPTAWVGLLALLVVSGCLHTGQPVVADRSPVFGSSQQSDTRSASTYTVNKGDTLYSIAWRYELNYLDLARSNALTPPYLIYPGQKMRLAPQLAKSRRITQTKVTKSTTAPLSATKSPTNTEKTQAPRPTANQWVWPLGQKPDVEYGKSSKGMDFSIGDRSSAAKRVRAASSGEVVYAGNGIGGYERLIIIKHARDLLSAYSFDGLMKVSEQQWVKAGEQVADIKNRGRAKQALHFELRKDGEPINPRSVLR